MQRKFTFIFTLKGFIFGVVFLGIFVVTPLTIIITYFYSGLDSVSLGGIIAGLIAGLSLKFKMYWNWADRVMAKLFRSNGSKQEE